MAANLKTMPAILDFQVAHRADLTSSPQRTFVPNLVLVSQSARLVPLSSPLYRCLTVLMGEPGRLCVGDLAGLPGLCVFLGNTSVVLTWAGTGRVDISVQLLVGFVILLHYKCRP